MTLSTLAREAANVFAADKTEVYLSKPPTKDRSTRLFSCPQCGASTDANSPSAIKHRDCCIYVGGDGC